MATYPSAIVTTATLITVAAPTTTPTNNPSHAGQHSNLNDEVIAIETTLGTNPQGAYATVAAALSSIGIAVTTAQSTADSALTNAATAQSTASTALTIATAAQATATTALTNAAAAQTTASGARVLVQALTTWVAGNVSAGTAYVVAPYAGTVTGYYCQGGAAPTSPGLATVTVGSAGAILLTATIASAGIAGLVTAFTNTSGTTTITAGASMLINLAGSGTAFQQSVTLVMARTA